MTAPRVLVLGAYSAIGKCIVRELLEQTECLLTATGRDGAKLDAVKAALAHPRLTFSQLDAEDAKALEALCREARLVVNCVGPYIMSGYPIARTVVESGRHYLDFAFEQFHFGRLKTLDAAARSAGVALVTGAGQTVGISSILALDAAARLPGLQRISICFMEGALRDGDSGFSSFVNGALEPALANQDYVDGRHVTCRLGSEILERTFPAPYGRTKMLCDPSIDNLILPERIPLREVKNYFGIGMEIPFGFFTLMRLLNPYRNRVFYRWTARVVRRIMARNRALQRSRSGPAREPLMRVEAESAEQALSFEVRFSNQFNGTALLPVLISRMLLSGELATSGLRTALDLVTPERLYAEMERYRGKGYMDWTISGPRPKQPAVRESAHPSRPAGIEEPMP